MCIKREDYSKVKNQEPVNFINTKPQTRIIDNGFENIGGSRWQDTETGEIYNSNGNLLTASSNENIFETIIESLESIYYTARLQIQLNRKKQNRKPFRNTLAQFLGFDSWEEM